MHDPFHRPMPFDGPGRTGFRIEPWGGLTDNGLPSRSLDLDPLTREFVDPFTRMSTGLRVEPWGAVTRRGVPTPFRVGPSGEIEGW